LLLLAFDASAQGQQRPPVDQGEGAGAQRMRQGQQRQQQRRGDGSAAQGKASATQPAQFSAGDGVAAGGQMSREERRQLRRDVDQAGRDLYPERRRGGRHYQNSQ